ncbi:splicing regulatory glutamine/lysine-rich protein 1-like [Anoplophora glabripennis]|uniref:splicing regulatory glutamine/lysine-rich protein 1-like n=1 Tax=Anoplophora glabripennis TaxID=217634 RepID=UPI000873D8F6|nr:splicing regulatory glutamine/lysine-rich protein 1-like [Anoplophora glabripennis]
MAKTGNQPRLLTAVMEAIANLKEGRGSTQKRIIDQVQCLLSANKMTFRNPVVHIKKALRHGVHTGLIKQKGGKFRLGLDSKDYAIFKNFQKLKKREHPVREHKRGKRRRKRSKRRRKRRRSSADEDATASGSASDSISGTPEPSDRGRRRRKKKRRRRGRKRTEEREWSNGHGSSEPKEVSPSSSNEQSKSERDRDKDRDRERSRDRDKNKEEEHYDGNKY